MSLAISPRFRYHGGMKKFFVNFFCLTSILLSSVSASAAVLRFFSNPAVPQALFHVNIEYKGIVYDGDVRGSEKYPVASAKKETTYEIWIPDELVNQVALESQIGRRFDYTFTWTSEGTYCSKLVGLGLNMKPVPMSFAGTHYLKYYPHWATRNDPGISLDQVWEYGFQNGYRIK